MIMKSTSLRMKQTDNFSKLKRWRKKEPPKKPLKKPEKLPERRSRLSSMRPTNKP